MDQSTQGILETANTAFLYVFTAEAGLKVFGLGWTQFVVDSFNVFDLVIVLIGYLEYIPFTKLPGGNGIISAFRIFRLARVFKAAKYWPSMQAIIKTLIDTLPSLGYLTVVLCRNCKLLSFETNSRHHNRINSLIRKLIGESSISICGSP